MSFSREDVMENPDAKDLTKLWDEYRLKAFEAAREDAAVEFNKCPMCGTWVCDDCFYVADETLTDVCTNCIQGMKQ